MEIPNYWLPIVFSLFILFVGVVGGYSVLKKRVKDLEDDNKKGLTEEKHESLCKIASFEMKDHVSQSMEDTIDNFNVNTFQPAFKQLLKAINGD